MEEGFTKADSELKHVLFLSVCLTLVTFPSSLAAPPRIRRMTCTKPTGTPKWIDPCNEGPSKNFPVRQTNLNTNSLAESHLTVQQVRTHTEAAKRSYREHFKKEKFFERENFQGLESWNWLPLLPTNVTPAEFYEGKNWDEILLDLYKLLQTYAVGLEQVTFDLQKERNDLSEEFTKVEGYLRQILCELYQVLSLHGVTIDSNVTRDVMPDSLRCETTNSRRLDNNWFILSEYINALEFTDNVLGHLKERK